MSGGKPGRTARSRGDKEAALLTVDTTRRVTQRLLNTLFRLHFGHAACWILARLPLHAVMPNIWLRGYDYYEHLSRCLRNRCASHGISLVGRRVLEIGAGNSLGTGYFLLDECQSCAALDLTRSPNMSGRAFRNELALIERVRAGQVPNLDQFCHVDDVHKRVVYTDKASFHNLNIADERAVASARSTLRADVIHSWAVLEHIRKEQLGAALRNMHMLLDTGGYMFHVIDLRDHFNFDYPFHFYRYTEAEWTQLAGGSVFYTNRTRYKEFIAMFESAGFEVVDATVSRLDSWPTNMRLAREFQGRVDLGIPTANLLLRKI